MIALRITALLALLFFGLAAHGAPIATSQHLSAPLAHLVPRVLHEHLPVHPSVSKPGAEGSFESEVEKSGKGGKVLVHHKDKATGAHLGTDEHTLDDKGHITHTTEHRPGEGGTTKTRHMTHEHDGRGRLQFTQKHDAAGADMGSTTYQYQGDSRSPHRAIHVDKDDNARVEQLGAHKSKNNLLGTPRRPTVHEKSEEKAE